MTENSLFKNQIIPIALTAIVAAALTALLWLEIFVLNKFISEDILLRVRFVDITIGLTIYLKTSIDFAIYIGRLMDQNPGWKSRVAIEMGTALGNAAGTFAILALWAFFKEVKWLLVIMIALAALVLFKLAEDSLEHAKVEDEQYPRWFKKIVNFSETALVKFNKAFVPILKFVVPNVSPKGAANLKFWALFSFAFTVPFVLGLDDFAGYVPLFSIVNVFGFAIGVFAGHMLLNMFLYLSPQKTIKAVKNPIISLLGSYAFVGLGIWGFVEVAKLIGH
ncbi:MAG: hypothetical protein Q8R08_00340 [bacterium]|nr:hypothetical protein [bacterium]